MTLPGEFESLRLCFAKKRIINVGDIQLIGAVEMWGLVLVAVAGAA